MPFPQPPFNSPVQTEPTIKGIVTIKAVWQNWLQLVQMFLANLTDSGPTSARPTTDLWVGRPFFDTTINVPVYWDGSTWVTSSPTGTVTAVTGTSPIASSGGTTPNISITEANATTDGYLSAADWNTFNNKQPSGTYVNSVGGTAPVVSSGGTSPVISMAAANGTTNGYLTSTDWNAFHAASTAAGTFINVKNYGATGNGSTDDTTAIQNAINANRFRTIYFPAGQYLVSSLTITTGITLLGDDSYASAIYSTSLTGDVINYTSDTPLNVSNLTFTSSTTTRTSGAYITINSSGDNGKSRITNCQFISSYIGLNFVTASDWVVTSCYWSDYSVGIQVQNTVNIDSGDSCVTSCTFSSSIGGISIAQYSSGGLKIVGNKFLNATYHYLGQFVTGAGSSSTSILVIAGNSFEGATSASVALNTSSNSFSQVNVTGNQFSLVTSGTKGFLSNGTSLSNVFIGANEFSMNNGATAINIGGGSGFTIGPNSINGTSSDAGIAIYNSASVHVCPQGWNGVTNRYVSFDANTRFDASQMQTGSMPTIFTTTSYGVPTLYYGEGSQTFPIPFQGTPAVNAYIYDPTGVSGAVGVQLTAVSASGFSVRVIGANSSGAVTIYYTALLSG
jgi:trimeric autotransporter adhesin